MERLSKILNWTMWFLFFCISFYIMLAGGKKVLKEDASSFLSHEKNAVQNVFLKGAAQCLYPGLFLEGSSDHGVQSIGEWYIQGVMSMHPLCRMENATKNMGGKESTATYEMLITGGVHDENEQDESGNAYNMETLAEAENGKALEQQIQKEQEKEQEEQKEKEEQIEQALSSEEEVKEEDTKPLVTAGTIYNLEELSDFDFLFSHFYTMENNTIISAEDLNAEKLLSKDMSIDKSVDGPQILIYHTHSQEGFVDSIPGDNSTTIVGVGEYLTQLLQEKGYQVMHVTSVYDFINGKLDRNEAYSKAEAEISAILAENPSIQSVIDLHRDGVKEGTHLVTEINGKPTAKFMFFNGLSRTKKNGPIDYLYNPYIEDNLALTLQLKLMCEQYYPGLSRNIYLKSLRYNLHLSDKALLIEVGAQTNTLQEMLNTMEPLSDVLDKVFNP